jgi:TonB-linked SusC/RagA family outer membrane protein
VTAQAQPEVSVHGRVSDMNGSPLVGVTVVLKNTSQGTTTDVRGQYHLNAHQHDTLVFSYLGYDSKSVVVEGSTVNVQLASSNRNLNEVVVVGYGTQQQKDVTGSIGTVNMQAIKNQPITGADQAMVAQIPGVQVNATNGIPGGGPQVVIRGVGAIGADNTPLYVVDGFPLPDNNGQGARQQNSPLTNIPPEDIASITVLKDASATAIYGSRGANGVVIITTKSGEAGKMKFGVDMYTGWQRIPSYEKPKMMNAEQFAEFQKDIIEDNNVQNGTSTAVPEEYQNPSQYKGKGTNWFDAMTRVAPMQSFNFNLSGGTQNLTTYMSAGYLRQEGTVIGTDYNRINLRVNVKGNLGKKWHVGLNITPTYDFGNNSATGGNDRNDYYGVWEVVNPIPSIYNADGTYNTMIGTTGTWNQPNPVMVLNQVVRKHTSTEIISSGYVSYDILPSLTLKSTINVDLHNEDQNNFVPSTLGGTNSPPPHIPSGSYSFIKFFNWANENSLSYQHSFPGGHSLSVVGDFSEQQEVYQNGAFNGSQYPDDAVTTLNAAALITGGTNRTAWGLVSYLGRVNYSYKDKYLLTAAVRKDGSSKFGENNRWGTFPSIALGWDIIQEPWMKNRPTALSGLKLRASYGLAGNDEIANFGYLSSLVSGNYVLGGSLAGGRVVTSISNQDLAWEKTGEYNIGLDLGLFDDRIRFTADVYKSKTQSLVLSVQIPPSSGFTSTTENIGAVQNKGFEFTINSANIVSHNFTWTSNVNFSLNRNKALALGPNQTFIQAGTSMEGHPTNITQIGQPVGMFFGYKVLGLYQSADDVAKNPHFADAIPGNLKVLDANGDGTISPVSDFTVIGNPYPKFNYGITSSMSYKQFDLNFVLAGSYGADMLDASMASYHNIDGIFNVLSDMTKRWRSASDPGDGKHPTTAGPSLGRVMYRDVNSLNVFSASYLWCKNISLQYTLPKGALGKYFNNIQVYGSVQNAFVLTSYPGNPTGTNYTGASSFGSALTPGIDYSNYPTARVFVIGLRLDY